MLWMTVSPAQLISNRIIFNFATHDRMAISITFLFGMQTSNTSKKHEIALLHPLFLDTFATKVTKSSKSQNTTEKVSHLLLKWTLFGINLPRLRRGSLLHLLHAKKQKKTALGTKKCTASQMATPREQGSAPPSGRAKPCPRGGWPCHNYTAATRTQRQSIPAG